MSELRYSPEALTDLDEIWDYIVSDLANPDAAQNTVDSILNAADRLRDYPESGALLASVADIVSDYRFVPVGNYLLFYRARPGEVFIDRILYGRRNYLRVLFGEKGQ